MTQSRSAPPARRPSANLSPAQIRAAIPQLEARIAELEAFPVETIGSRNDPRILALQSAIDSTLDRAFGAETNEYHRLRQAKILDTTPYIGVVQLGANFRGGPPVGGTPIHEIQEGIERGRQRAVALLTQEVAMMKEHLGDDEDSPGDRAIHAYANLDLHPEIARAASELYRNGHYPNAIEDAVKALSAWVRYRSDETIDGTVLMEKVFSPKSPVLRFNGSRGACSLHGPSPVGDLAGRCRSHRLHGRHRQGCWRRRGCFNRGLARALRHDASCN